MSKVEPAVAVGSPAAVLPSPRLAPPSAASEAAPRDGVPAASSEPPPVEVHKELIPRSVDIARVYYDQGLAAPGSSVAFDVNGSGFDSEFEKMIAIESGAEGVTVRDLRLVTPNQIRGTLLVGPEAATAFVFPRVVIGGKVVFQAPEPLGVIRPGEVLNFVLTEVGENGGWGRFRVFTNLTERMLGEFSVVSSTGNVVFSELRPELPFVVDGTVNIGAASAGEHDVVVMLGGKAVWSRPALIKIVRPNVGNTGLIRSVVAADAYHRPGDKAGFVIGGSGLRPQDARSLTAKAGSLGVLPASFKFVGPGRMELAFHIPLNAAATTYALAILCGDRTVLEAPAVFSVVGKNWTRSVSVEPAVAPGDRGALVLTGRDFDRDFIEDARASVDEPGLVIGAFKRLSPEKASADILVGKDVAPGDYWIRIFSGGKTVSPALGAFIRVGKESRQVH